MFKDRADAGRKLAQKLRDEVSSEALSDSLLLAIPRGGIVVGSEIAKAFKIPMDSLVIKKIPAPENEELAIGAVADGGTIVWEEELVKRLGVTNEYKEEIVKKKISELEQKKDFFRGEKELLDIRGKTVILVDDGVATGATIKAGIAVVRSFRPGEIIVAVPVISQDILEEIKQRAEEVIYLEVPEMFFSVAQSYESFEQLTDEQIKKYLK